MKKRKPIGKCIYCNEIKELSAEHYLPESLGLFKNFETLDDRVCKVCNSKIGEAEEQFSRISEVGINRYILGIEGKNKGKRKQEFNPFLRGSAGMKPLEIRGAIQGQDLELRFQLAKGGDGAELITYMIMTSEGGEKSEVIIPKDMVTKEQFEKLVQGLGIDLAKINHVALICPIADNERLINLLPSHLTKDSNNWKPLPESGSIKSSIKIEVDTKNFRAIAKIAFHYVLKHLNFHGDEDSFSEIRDFIINGGETSKFVTWTNEQFIEQIKEGHIPDTHHHIIYAKVPYIGMIQCRLQFFIGPNFPASVYTVNIGMNPSRINCRRVSAHQFTYYEEGKKDGFVGEMKEVFPIQNALIP